jgi:hypothetical protein
MMYCSFLLHRHFTGLTCKPLLNLHCQVACQSVTHFIYSCRHRAVSYNDYAKGWTVGLSKRFFSGASTQLHIPQTPEFIPGSKVAAQLHLMSRLRIGRGCGQVQLYLYLQLDDFVLRG